ncbi:uncharacterized protein LOC108247055 [Kryptolebias marmoratus]|uniref:uncharacterized protein LOC108247055 n=1 Tax=Kryptolebias marmoratus TaxID=37003 RepID=UPI0007F92F03|nr:uncharacterized protein LOC108247055 [Kryptolebias marmoratus]
MFVVFILLLQFKGAGSKDLHLIVRAGDDVTLSCENVIKGCQNCDTSTWLYDEKSEELVTLGKVRITRSDRLSLTANCSLLIKKVTAEDVGRYTCRQFVSGQQEGSDARVQVSVVSLTEQKNQNQNQVTFSCSVSTDGRCKHEVRWLFKGNEVDKDHQEINKLPLSSCSAAVIVSSNHFLYESKHLLKCEVKTAESKVQLFPFSSHPADEKTTSKTAAATASVPAPPGGDNNPSSYLLWVYISVPLVLVVLIIVITLIMLKRNKGKKTQKCSNTSPTSDPAETRPALREIAETAEPDDGVSYAAISYTRKSNNNSKVQIDDEDDTVTYSTVKAPASDPSSL